MMKKILAVFAHPDDETFGPGGTLAKYAQEGVEIHLLCATRGERGEWSASAKASAGKQEKIHHIREKELLRSAKILGIKKVEFLNFVDGYLCNSNYHDLAQKIITKIKSFKPQVILTLDRLGISGHLDHIAVSMVTTYSFLKTSDALKLYYLCLPQKWYDRSLTEYFIYFPEGKKEEEITTRINYQKYWEVRKKSMMQHETQTKDVNSLLKRFNKWPKIDNYILAKHRLKKVILPETDLFSGI